MAKSNIIFRLSPDRKKLNIFAVRACPFCDMPPAVKLESGVRLVKCQNQECLPGAASGWVPESAWSRRPGERRLMDQAKKARREARAAEKNVWDANRDARELEASRSALEVALAQTQDRLRTEVAASLDWEIMADRLARIAEHRRIRLLPNGEDGLEEIRRTPTTCQGKFFVECRSCLREYRLPIGQVSPQGRVGVTWRCPGCGFDHFGTALDLIVEKGHWSSIVETAGVR